MEIMERNKHLERITIWKEQFDEIRDYLTEEQFHMFEEFIGFIELKNKNLTSHTLRQMGNGCPFSRVPRNQDGKKMIHCDYGEGWIGLAHCLWCNGLGFQTKSDKIIQNRIVQFKKKAELDLKNASMYESFIKYEYEKLAKGRTDILKEFMKEYYL